MLQYLCDVPTKCPYIYSNINDTYNIAQRTMSVRVPNRCIYKVDLIIFIEYIIIKMVSPSIYNDRSVHGEHFKNITFISHFIISEFLDFLRQQLHIYYIPSRYLLIFI